VALHHFGIRHHGPGCARSLARAFDALRPDCVLIEGPPEGDALVPLVAAEGMTPPVALLSYCPDEPQLAVYHPFAEFSPEWQALRWAVAHGVPARFIDLPRANDLALEKAQRERDVPPESPTESDETPQHSDPLDWLACAAGYGDGEAWWNHMVEERGDGEQLFAAIDEAMVVLRTERGVTRRRDQRDEIDAQREALREAHMRQSIRAAGKEGFERIAVVCGAWHLAGLKDDQATAKADAALLKPLPKLKVNATWVPWTYRHLLRASGYGAGIRSPGWYEHLWRCADASQPRAVGWLARVARLMRERDLDCSSAHLIEATRLADSLAALRERPAPGLDELHEATRAVLTLGDDAVLRFIDDELVVGDRLGSVPPSVPTVPLQRDLEAAQKSLRLKPEALSKTLDLDLRQPNDLARSHLLHRLNLLDLPWGTLAKTGRSARGSFHEVWTLQWQPEFALRLIEASQWGQTVAQAASARTIDRCGKAESLEALSSLVDRALLADLDTAVASATRALNDRAAVTGDALQLLGALPPLANVFRYGNVRQTDSALVAHVLDGLIVRASIGLPLSTLAIDDAAAESLRDKLLTAHAAVGLRDAAEQSDAWQRALGLVAAQDGAHALVGGLCVRLLLDAAHWDSDDVARAMSLQMSSGAEPAKAAGWLDGFLNRNATVLLHDATVWRLLDDWIAGLSDEHFVRVLPLVRRSFGAFGPGERRDLAQRASQGVASAAAPNATPTWDERRAALPLPLLRRLIGLEGAP
jgi:hypothetical protein